MDIAKIEGSFSPTSDKKCSVAKKGMVSTAFPEATRAGVSILKKGGNAVDAACASAIALGVCEPQASGIGGQSLAILYIKENRRVVGIDGSSRAPSLSHIDSISKKERATGYKATTVPSTLATMAYMNSKYGKLEWQAILEPAVRIARKGYKITELQNRLQSDSLEKFFNVPSRSGARYFLKDGAEPYKVGDNFVQPELADLLEDVAENGVESFYTGKVARKIEEDMINNGGLLRASDMEKIPWPEERRAIKRRYREVDVYTLPPPTAGRTLLLVLMMLNNLNPKFLRSGSPKSYHFVAESFRKAFLQRTLLPHDPRNVHNPKKEMMLNRKFANGLSKSIRDMIDPVLPLTEPDMEDFDTTHLSVMDSEGNAAGVTQSIEQVYGSKAAAEGLGFLYNNYISAFEFDSPDHPHYLKPNTVPWTLVAPSVLFHKNALWMVLGSPGSQRIFSSVSHFISRMIDGELPMSEAMMRPRMHCSLSGVISLEADRFDQSTIDHLKRMGYKIDRREPFSFYHGAIHAVLKRISGNGFQGVAEVRRNGTAEGPD